MPSDLLTKPCCKYQIIYQIVWMINVWFSIRSKCDSSTVTYASESLLLDVGILRYGHPLLPILVL